MIDLLLSTPTIDSSPITVAGESILTTIPATSLSGIIVYHNDTLYISPGRDRSGRSQRAFFRYTLADKVITTLTPPPAATAFGAVALVHNDSIYMMGGSTAHAASAVLYRYDIAANTWSTLATPPTSRMMHCGWVRQNKLYFAGGSPSTAYSSFYSTIDVYDIETNTWTSFTPAGLSLTAMQTSAVLLNGAVLFIGGYSNGAAIRLLRELNLTTLQMRDVHEEYGWTIADRDGFLTEIDGKIVYFLGAAIDANPIPIYRLKSSHLPEQIGEFSEKLFGAAWVRVGKRVYAYGGSPAGSSSTATGIVREFVFE